MDISLLGTTIQEHFGSDVQKVTSTARNRMLITIRREALLEIANYFIEQLRFRFIIATGMVVRKGYQVLYHFSDDASGNIVNLEVDIPKDNPEVDSLANMIHAANWIEREMHDLFGIVFRNHPENKPFIADGNWEEGVFPYAKNR